MVESNFTTVHPQEGFTDVSLRGASPVFFTVNMAVTLVVVPAMISGLLTVWGSISILGPAKTVNADRMNTAELNWINFNINHSILKIK